MVFSLELACVAFDERGLLFVCLNHVCVLERILGILAGLLEDLDLLVELDEAGVLL